MWSYSIVQIKIPKPVINTQHISTTKQLCHNVYWRTCWHGVCDRHIIQRLTVTGADIASINDGLSAVLHSFGLVQLIKSPTRDIIVLDVLATDECESFIMFTGVHINNAGCISDHQLVRAKICSSNPAHQTVESTYRNIWKSDIPSFEHAVRQSALFSSSAHTADEFANQMADNVIWTRQSSITKEVHPMPLKSITRWLSPEAIAAKENAANSWTDHLKRDQPCHLSQMLSYYQQAH